MKLELGLFLTKLVPRTFRSGLSLGAIGGAFVSAVAAFSIWTFAPSYFPHREHNHITAPRTSQETIQDISAQTVADYTEVLAWFTGVLALVSICQIYFLIRTDKRAADASAEAAEQFQILSRQADTAEKQLAIHGLQTDVLEKQKEISRFQYFADHRPRLVFRDVYFSGESEFGEVSFEVTNQGGSRAEITGGFIALDFVADPRDFKNANGRDLEPLGKNALLGGQFRPFAVRTSELTQRRLSFLATSVGDGRARTTELIYGDPENVPKGQFYFFGMVFYTDERGQAGGATYASVFRREWNPRTGSFERSGNPDHEYSD